MMFVHLITSKMRRQNIACRVWNSIGLVSLGMRIFGGSKAAGNIGSSSETGGIAFFPKNIEQVDEIAAEVARDIRSQYTIGYHSNKPSNQPGFRRVQVTAEAPGMGKLSVRTRTGYFPESRAKRAGATKK